MEVVTIVSGCLTIHGKSESLVADMKNEGPLRQQYLVFHDDSTFKSSHRVGEKSESNDITHNS